MRYSLPLLALICWTAPAAAALEVKDLQAAHGLYGPERTSLEVMPQDELFFRFRLEGVKSQPDGKTEIEEVIRVLNGEGKAVFEKTGTVARPVSLGGGSLTTQVLVNLGPKTPPGEYTVRVSFKDRLSGESTSFERKITCKPTSFAILAPRFSRDAEGKIPAPLSLMVNEPLHFKLICVGFEKKEKQVKVVMRLEVLDEGNKNILVAPVEVKGFILKPEEAESAVKLTFNGTLLPSRAGTFKLRVILEDQLGKQSAKFEAPLKISTP